jgi:hypothetical protein
MTYLHVKLLNDSLDKSTADIVPHQTPQGFVYSVYSDNPKMKTHIEKLLTLAAYIPAPGRNDANFFADSAMELQPNSIYFVNAIPEILSWRGYNAEVKTEVHKSLMFDDFVLLDAVKSALPDGIIYNSDGERVVKYVPKGYVAVHSDGRTVAGGKFLNANIDKDGAQWSLVANQYESQTPAQRGQMKEYMDVGLEDYHPGVEEELYQEREEGQPQYKLQREYKPQEAVSLTDFYERSRVSVDVPRRFPVSLEPGNIVYSPQTGQAFDSKFWPPQGVDYENIEWYVFPGSKFTEEEKSLYAPVLGLTPQVIPGTSSGIVQSERDLDVSGGFKLGFSDSVVQTQASNSSLVAPNSVTMPKFEIRDMLDADWKKSYKTARDLLQKVTALTRDKIDEELQDLKVPNLRGANATFQRDLYPHQKAVVMAMTAESQYEVYGGPKGWHGYFLNVKMGLGKTAMVTAANAIMRNRGLIRNGTQTTIVTAPNKNIYVWRTEVGNFLGEHAVVIDGDRQTRIQQWENIVEKAKNGELPSFIIVGASKFRHAKNENDEDELDAWELDTDAKYMQLLAAGGKSGDVNVSGNHVGALVIDESGQYVNPESSRHVALRSIVDSVYGGKGIVWTLNGNISGNSATDTISELAFINKYARDNYIPLVQEYTKTNRETTRETKSMDRRVWKDHTRLRDFFYTFGAQIYSLSGETVAGKDYGLMRTDDETTPMGPEWGSVYLEAERKLEGSVEAKLGSRSMGLLSILINSGFGSISPARLMEYELGKSKIISDVKSRLSSEDFQAFMQEYNTFMAAVTDDILGVGKFPKKGLSVGDRDTIYNTLLSEGTRSLLEDIVSSWTCPYTDGLVSSIQNDLQQNTPAGRHLKIGIAGFSRTSINKIAKKLRERYPDSKYLIQVVDGGVDPKEVDAIQKRHQSETEKPVITLVTGAGAYGLSLPSDRTYRAPMWNSATALQFEGRFHRKAEQKNLVTVMIPEGITQYMRELELRKGNMASSATNTLLEVDDEGDEVVINSSSIARLLDKMRQYRPRILEGN